MCNAWEFFFKKCYYIIYNVVYNVIELYLINESWDVQCVQIINILNLKVYKLQLAIHAWWYFLIFFGETVGCVCQVTRYSGMNYTLLEIVLAQNSAGIWYTIV